MAYEIVEVLKGSPAKKAGIMPGQKLISINNVEIKDVLDYRFYTVNSHLFVMLENKDGHIIEKEIKKPEYEDLGLVFESYLMDEPKSCHNKCIFCFIDQLPKGLRPTLYFKDDDTRLSFLTGNYVTLTNIKDSDIDRIIKQRISPINISVHATDPEVRKAMIGNRFAGNILNYIQRLSDAGIPMNAQLVICRDVNDKEVLKKSMEDLKKFVPALKSVSIVPVGITKFREGLYPLIPFDKQSAKELLDMVLEFSNACKDELETRLFYAADEFYVLSDRQVPHSDFYEDFLQIENGVGLMASLKDEFLEAIEDTLQEDFRTDEFSIATGEAAYEFICTLVDEVRKKCHNLRINLYKIENNFFGKSITVSGLLTGQDIIEQLENKNLGSSVYISCAMLKSGTDIFLDDLTKQDLEDKFNVPFYDVSSNGYEFLDIFLKK